MKEEKYYIYDYETGTPIEVTKEQKEKHIHAMYLLWANVSIKGITPMPRTLMLYGTGGDFDIGNVRELFYKPEPFIHRPFEDETTSI